MYRKAVFIDKDGTLVRDIPFNTDLKRIVLEEFAVEGLQKLISGGYDLMIITNQPGISLGLIQMHELDAIRMKVTELLEHGNIPLSGFYYCPHSGKEIPSCNCRKPAPGLILRAAAEQQVNIKESWMIGDILNDVEAGNRAGCRTVLIDNGNETEWTRSVLREPDLMVKNLNEAAEAILYKKKNS